MGLFGPTTKERELAARVEELETTLFDALVSYTWSMFSLGHRPPVTLGTFLLSSRYTSEEVIAEATRRYNLNAHPKNRR